MARLEADGDLTRYHFATAAEDDEEYAAWRAAAQAATEETPYRIDDEQDGLVLHVDKGHTRLAVPQAMRTHLLELAHDDMAHFGIDKTAGFLRDYLLRMHRQKADIESYLPLALRQLGCVGALAPPLPPSLLPTAPLPPPPVMPAVSAVLPPPPLTRPTAAEDLAPPRPPAAAQATGAEPLPAPVTQPNLEPPTRRSAADLAPPRRSQRPRRGHE